MFWFCHADSARSGCVTVMTATTQQAISLFLVAGTRSPGLTTRTVDRDDRVRTIIEMQQEAGIYESERARIARAMHSGPGEECGYVMRDGGQRIEYVYRPWK
jgi:hypothetical protein